jgi:hypothetical protein
MDDPADGRQGPDRPGPEAVTVVDATEAEWLAMAERARGYLRALGETAEG